ncbi:hypothetical protein QE152_g36993 [Popillia japonica]|uniref:Uncharacterized protein n=1 Tax=Popillia japonica TaxID=7064 RepID=A0AAW1IBU2_POPJA
MSGLKFRIGLVTCDFQLSNQGRIEPSTSQGTDENVRVVSSQLPTDALVYVNNALREQGVLVDNASETISETTQAIGLEIVSSIHEILDSHALNVEKDITDESEIDTVWENVYEEVSTSSSDDSNDMYEPEVKRKRDYDIVPLNMKVKVHPSWSLESLRSRTSTTTVLADDTRKQGAELHQVTTRDLQLWALAAANQFQGAGFRFAAGKT